MEKIKTSKHVITNTRLKSPPIDIWQGTFIVRIRKMIPDSKRPIIKWFAVLHSTAFCTLWHRKYRSTSVAFLHLFTSFTFFLLDFTSIIMLPVFFVFIFLPSILIYFLMFFNALSFNHFFHDFVCFLKYLLSSLSIHCNIILCFLLFVIFSVYLSLFHCLLYTS